MMHLVALLGLNDDDASHAWAHRYHFPSRAKAHTHLHQKRSQPPSAHLKWKFEVASFIAGTPAVDPITQMVYFGSDDQYMYALNQNGSFQWRYETGGSVHSSPAVDGNYGTVYFGSNNDFLFALNRSGSLQWKFEAKDEVQTGIALSSDGILYAGTDYGNVLALYANNGTLKWRHVYMSCTDHRGRNPALRTPHALRRSLPCHLAAPYRPPSKGH